MKYCFLFFLLITTTLHSFSQGDIVFSPSNTGQTFSTCGSFVVDSGGQGGPGYSDNENTVITVCSDTPGDIVSITFNLFNLSLQDDNPLPNVTNVDYMTVYDGMDVSANTLGTYTGTELQGVVIIATNLNTSGCLTFEFSSNSIGTGVFSGSASCNTPCSDPVAGGVIVGGITADSIRVCVGESVSFQNQGSSAQAGFNIAGYLWDFMDNTSSTQENPTHSFNIPGIYKVQLYVTDDNTDNVCTNNNLIDLQVLVATKPNFTGFPGDTVLCLGEAVQFTATPDDYEVLWTGFPTSASITEGCLEDDQLGVAQNVDLVQTAFVAGATITNTNQIESICIDLEHTFMGDLVIQLNCPNGQSIILHQQGGGSTMLGIPVEEDGVACDDPSTIGIPYTYCFAPDATQTWVGWVSAQTGFGLTLPEAEYLPIDPFSNLIGCPANGVWTISVTDNWASDDGCLFSFGLNLIPTMYPDLPSFEPQIGLGIDSSYWDSSGSFITSLSADGNVINITPTSAGIYNYNYTVVDNFGCTNDTNVNVVVSPDPNVFAGNDTTICDGAVFQLDGQVSGTSDACDYILLLEDIFGDGWTGNTLTIDIGGVVTNYTMNGSEETYVLNIVSGAPVTAVFNCEGTWPDEAAFSITDPTGVVVVNQNFGMTAPTSDAFVADCPPAYVYNWSSVAAVSDASILNPQFISSTQQLLNLSVYPIGHPLCVLTDDILVNVAITPNAGTDNTLSICSTAAPTDLFPLLGAGVSPNGVWTNPTGNIITMPFDPATMSPGTYTYTVDNNGCSDQATVEVTELVTEITDTQFTNVDCHDAANGTITITATGISSYSLNNAPSVIAGSPFTINSLVPGDYFIVIKGAQGCMDDTNVSITEPDQLQITALSDDITICPNTGIPLSIDGIGGNGDYIYTWSDGAAIVGVGSVISVSPTVMTEYCVTMSEICGSPEATECVTVDIAAPIIPIVTPDVVAGCYPLRVSFSHQTVSNDVKNVTVDFGDGKIQTYLSLTPFFHNYMKEGVYTVTVRVRSNIGCDYEVTYPQLIEAFGFPKADFKVNPDSVSMFYPFANLINLSSSDVVSQEWNCALGTPSFATTQHLAVNYPLDSARSYPVKLVVMNEHGCKDSIVKSVIVYDEVLLFVPNTFTPNSDAINQTWRVHSLGLDDSRFFLKVFNRWGEIVWQTKDINEAWDGTYKGESVVDGAYSWIIDAGVIYNDKRYTFNGSVSVIR